MSKVQIFRVGIISAAIYALMSTAGYAQTASSRSSWQTRNVVMRIQTKTAQFRAYARGSIERQPQNTVNREERLNDILSNFENATQSLRADVNANRQDGSSVQTVLDRALLVDRFVARNRLSVAATNQWASIKTDLNTLARINNISWTWSREPDYQGSPAGQFPGAGRGFDARLTGTYRLNASQSDDVNQILGRYDSVGDAAQQDRRRRNLERRLTPPETLVIDKAGESVTLASNLSPQVTFQADGVARTETSRSGRTIRTTASANRDSLLISYEGDRINDFYLTFNPTRDGQLRVTRRVYVENQNQTVSVTSVYDKINNVARFESIAPSGDWNAGNANLGRGSDRFYIPNGTRLTATLRNTVNTQASQVGDRFTMEVTSPNIYRGAIIEGRIANAASSGRVSGRASVSLDFNTITLVNGQSYQFAGVIDTVRTPNGDEVRVDNEGAVRDGNQTTRTATRAGIGAALGAVIGAIAGGGQGAAIGAAVGAGAGAGTVFIQGRDNIELGQGTEFGITATAPNSVGSSRSY